MPMRARIAEGAGTVKWRPCRHRPTGRATEPAHAQPFEALAYFRGVVKMKTEGSRPPFDSWWTARDSVCVAAKSLARVGVRSLRLKRLSQTRGGSLPWRRNCARSLFARALVTAADGLPALRVPGFHFGDRANEKRRALALRSSLGGPPGTRTPNQQIKSLLLYRLS